MIRRLLVVGAITATAFADGYVTVSDGARIHYLRRLACGDAEDSQGVSPAGVAGKFLINRYTRQLGMRRRTC